MMAVTVGLKGIAIASLALVLSGCVSQTLDSGGGQAANSNLQNTYEPLQNEPLQKPQKATIETANAQNGSSLNAMSLTGSKWVSTANKLHTIEFGEKNRVSGISGCQAYSGFYGQSGLGLNFTTLSTTRNICETYIMKDASVFRRLLQNTSNFQKLGETLVLKDKNKATLLVIKKQ